MWEQKAVAVVYLDFAVFWTSPAGLWVCLPKERYCHSCSGAQLQHLEPHSNTEFIQWLSNTKWPRAEMSLWPLPPLGSISAQETVGYVLFFPWKSTLILFRNPTTLLWIQHSNIKYIQGLLPQNMSQARKLLLDSTSLGQHVICTLNPRSRCFPSPVKVIQLSLRSSPLKFGCHLQYWIHPRRIVLTQNVDRQVLLAFTSNGQSSWKKKEVLYHGKESM